MNKLLTCLLLSASACTVTTSQDIDATQLSGTVAGTPWTFAMGDTDAFLSEGADDFYATLYPSAFTPCGTHFDDEPYLIVSIPKLPGDYQMDFSRNMTFVDPSTDDNMVAIDGRIVVDSVSDTEITGGLHGTYDFDNEVSGQFDLHICE